MAPRRDKGEAHAARANQPARRATRGRRTKEDGVKDVYADMVAEAASVDSLDDASDRPLKRRKVGAKHAAPSSQAVDSDASITMRAKGEQPAQMVEDSSISEEEDESDFGFEDVDLEHPQAAGFGSDGEPEDSIADVSVAVDAAPKRQMRAQRKPASAAEKAFRLLVHKAHVLCLLGHCLYINTWCNNEAVQRLLRPLLSRKLVAFLNPRFGDSQFSQNNAFLDGLQQACDLFRGEFRVTASGMRSAQWETDPNEEKTRPLDRSDFIAAARNLQGSQDTGNQLFCALLRAVGVEARLLCSLQALPFVSSAAKGSTPQKTAKPTVYAMPPRMSSPATGPDTDDQALKSSATLGKVPAARRRLGQPAFTSETVSTPSPVQKKPVRKLKYPVFWLEAFNPAHQKWVALDPMHTQTVNKPSKIEPPSLYQLNQLSYAIAFESDGVAKDVTRRYARAFNAKTRRLRVESTENGSTWFKKTMRLFRRRGALDRDQLEDAELVQREAREGLPANVLDFKDHPYYALERHLRRHEVIHPRREAGKVNAGTAAKPRMETVFRRKDVLACRSADKWFRVGRVIKEGEQPIKRVPARRPRRQRSVSADGEDEEEAMTPLYAPFQTKEYVPDPVVNGKVPRNAYGNLDIYVPSMVPAGGTHVRHALARDAARILRIDSVDAITGFQFKGRQGTAIKEGVIIPSEHADAIATITEGLEDEKTEEESRARSTAALRMWKRFLVGLKIQERVATYGVASTAENTADLDNGEPMEAAGGFLPSEAADAEILPTAGRFSLVELSTPAKATKRGKRKIDSESEEEADFTDKDEKQQTEADARPARSLRSRRRIVEDDEVDDVYARSQAEHRDVDEPCPPNGRIGRSENDGGFVREEVLSEEPGVGFIADDEGGGFMPDASEAEDGGGGFLARDDALSKDLSMAQDGDEDDGGCFLVGGEESDMASDPAGVPKYDVGTSTMSANSDVRPVLAENDAGSAVQDQLLPPKATSAQRRLFTTGHNVTEIAAATLDSSQRASAAPATAVESPHGAQRVGRAQSAEVSDKGSMLSHDPDDEDAEPDWLESD